MIPIVVLWIGPKHIQRTKVKLPDFYLFEGLFPPKSKSMNFSAEKKEENHINLGPLYIDISKSYSMEIHVM